MKYLVMIYSNPQSWGHPTFSRTSEFLAGSQDERDEMRAQFGTLMKEIVESGELIVGTPLADPVNSRTVRVRDGVPMVTDGPYLEAKEQLAGTSWSTVTARNGRLRSPRDSPMPGSPRWKCVRSWRCLARRCEHQR